MVTPKQHSCPEVKRVSVIVPAWNEQGQLPACLRSVGDLHREMELIVVDAGSEDRTVSIAREFGARVIRSPIRQRAVQLNLAAQEASGDVLLFLHADTILPSYWFWQLTAALDQDAQTIGGGFQRRFDLPSAWLAFTCALADWRSARYGLFLGDQAMFIRTAAFWSLGGFRMLHRCEDLDLSLRMARLGRTRLLRPGIMSSGRRFVRRGPLRQTFVDLTIAIRFIAAHRAAAIRQEPPVM